MPSLSLIEVEAERLVGSLSETRRQALQAALSELCETHWEELRGPEPAGALPRALWSVTPPWPDLLLDLYATEESRLADRAPGQSLANCMALLVFAEIERGNEAGVRIAHEPMMAFQTTSPPAAWLERISALVRGTFEPPLLHPHDRHPPLWKALAVIAAHTRRLDLPAAEQVISLLTRPRDQTALDYDEALDELRSDVHRAGIRFLGIDGDHTLLEQHGRSHKPVRNRQVGEMLFEIRQQWLG